MAIIGAATDTWVLATEPTGSRVDELAQDRELWKSANLVREAYLPPPAGWYTVTDQEAAATFSAPCEPGKTERQQGAIKAVVYSCNVDRRAYVVFVTRLELPKDAALMPSVFLSFAIRNDASMLRRFEQLGIGAQLIPRAWIDYGGLMGRQHTITTATHDMQVRLVQGQHGTISLSVADARARFPGDVDAFFNSLQLK